MKITRKRSRSSLHVGHDRYNIEGLHASDVRLLAYIVGRSVVHFSGEQGPMLLGRLVRILERATETGETLNREYITGVSDPAMMFQDGPGGATAPAYRR